MIAYGINREGKRDILAIEPKHDETEESGESFSANSSGGE